MQYGGPTIITNNSSINGYNTIINNNYQINQPPKNKVKIVYLQKSTKNKSFLDMHHYLKAIGVKNNAFMLTLLDSDLDGIDPHDPHLNVYYKQKVLKECLCNYWYFLREVVRLPSMGSKPMMYKLTRGNLALSFCQSLNLNIFYEAPRQQGKTVSAVIRYIYVYNFGTTNAKTAFLHKNMDGAKDNLQTFKDIRDLLPAYLIMKERLMPDGKVDKGKNNTTEILNPFNNNDIKIFASATNKARAASLLRGKTLSSIWYDEYAFLPYNDTIYMNAAPAYKTASMIAKQNGAPYGILITTTPGFMTTPEGQEAYRTKEDATKFSESWYDLSYNDLINIIKSNTSSDFVYIKFTYQELGCSEEWFKEVCRLLKNSWSDIRREILLEWSTGVDNSPFKEEDLDTISGLIKQPINITYLLGKYRFETYMTADTKTYPPLIGVDVSAGYKHDSSTITVIDSLTTKVIGCLNCNYISSLDLARCIEYIVKYWMPNAIVNVERNGGFGSSVISALIKMGLRRNLYYEIKDVVTEEKQDGIHSYKQKIRTKVYGLNSNREIRKKLIDILIERVENHKDKIISPIIYNELLGMEIKRNGKVEHSNSTHDDQIFSMLMALYMWYEGVNMAERFGLRKTTIKTDDNIDEQLDYYNDNTVEIVDSFNNKTEVDESIENDLNRIIQSSGILMNDFLNKRHLEEQEQLNALFNTPLGEKAFRHVYGIPESEGIEKYISPTTEFNIPYNVFSNFYKPEFDFNDNDIIANQQTLPSNQAIDLNDGTYNYADHFNF